MQRTLALLACACAVAFGVSGCGNTATCDGCTPGRLDGLAIVGLDTIPVNACVPVVIVTSETDPQRFPEATTLRLSGDINWYSSSACNLRVTSANVPAGARSVIAYVGSRTEARRTAEVREGSRGARKTIAVTAATDGVSALAVGGARFSDIFTCTPYWVQAVGSDGGVGRAVNPLSIELEGPRGAQIFDDSTCARETSTVVMPAGASGVGFFVRYTLPTRGELAAHTNDFTPATLQVDIVGEVLQRIAFAPSDAPINTIAGTCTPVALGIVDLTGQPLDVERRTLDLTATDGLSFFADNACTAAATTVDVEGMPASTFYVRAERVGAYTVTASADGFDSVARTVNVTPGDGSALAFELPDSIAVGGCYPVAVNVVDAFGNAPADNEPRDIALTGSPTLLLYGNANCGGATTGVTTIDNTAPFYIRGTTATAAAPIGATSNGLRRADDAVAIVPPANALAITGPSMGAAGACVALTVGAVNGGAPADVIADRSVALASDDRLAFYSDANCTMAVSAVTIAALTRDTPVWARTTAAADYFIQASAGGLATGTFSLSIGGALPSALTVSNEGLTNIGTCQPLTIGFRDQFGNVATNDRVRSVTFTASGGAAGGAFYSNDTCTTTTTSVSVSAVASATFWYRGAAVESPTITVRSTGLTEATTRLDIDSLLVRIRITDDNRRPVFRRMAVDPLTAGRIWAQTVDGVLWLTGDSGFSWVRQCEGTRGLINDNGQIYVSAGADHTAYLAFGNTVQRIDVGPGACRVITTGLGNGAQARDVGGFGIQPDGRLYFWGYDSTKTPPAQLWTSTNRGDSWTLVYADAAATGTGFGIVLSPRELNVQMVLRNGGGAGLYRSVDSGATFELVPSTGFTGPTQTRFDPAHAGYVYSAGRFSATNGASFTNSSIYNLSGAWAVDGSGALYRFNSTARNTFIIEKAPDATAPVWAAFTSPIPEPYNAATSGLQTTADGTFVALMMNGHVWTTSDNGATVTPLPPPPSAVAVNAWVTAIDGARAYALDSVWGTYKTTDGGVTWTMGAQAVPSAIGPYMYTSPTHPNDVYVRPESYNSTTDTTLDATHDAFTTVIGAVDRSAAVGVQTGAVSLTDPQVFYQIGPTMFRTLNGGVSGETKVTTLAAGYEHSAVGLVAPDDNDVVLLVAGRQLQRYNFVANSFVAITAAGSVAGLEAYNDGAGFTLRTIASNGATSTSTDFGSTFSSPTTPAPAAPTCFTRLVSSATTDRRRIATGCPSSTSGAISVDGGTVWTTRSFPCAVRQLSVTATGVVLACSAQTESRFVPF